MLSCTGSPNVALGFQGWDIPLLGVDAESTKMFPGEPSKFYVSSRKLGRGSAYHEDLEQLTGTWDNLPLQADSTSRNILESLIRFTLSCNSCIGAVSSFIVA